MRSARRRSPTKFGIPTVVTDFDALLKLDLDIVDICTPSALHFAQARKALLAGRHVVVEKPFASSLAEADALAELERKSGKRVSPIFQYRFANGIAQLLHLRAKGFAGKAYAATVETHWRRLPAYYANPWRGRWATELGGCLTTHAIHNHDILTYVLGPVASVYATHEHAGESDRDGGLRRRRARNGGRLVRHALGDARRGGGHVAPSLLLRGADGREQPQPLQSRARRRGASSPPTRSASRRSTRRSPKSPLGPERNAGQFLRLHKALTEGGPLPVSIADARPSLELLTAAYHSARTGEAVRLPLGRDHPLYAGWLPAAARAVA